MDKRIIFIATSDLATDQRMQRICHAISKDYDVLLVGRQLSALSLPNDINYKTQIVPCWMKRGKFFYIEYNLRLFILLLFTKFDIVSAVDLDTLMPAVIISKLKRKKVVFDAHEYFEEVPEVNQRACIKMFWQKVGDIFVPKVDYAYTVNKSLADLFTQKYNIPFGYIENRPVSEKIHSIMPKAQMQETIIYYQGVLNEGRGLELAVEAMNYLDGQLWLVGDGDIKDVLIKLVDKWALKGKVKFIGKVAPSELSNYNRLATMGINLLEKNGLSYYYSLANKFYDYVMADLPQISMAFPEYLRCNNEIEVAVLLPELSLNAYIDSVNKCLALINDGYFTNNIIIAKKQWVFECQEPYLCSIYKSI